MSSEEELFAKLDRWLADQPAAPTIFDVVRTRDGDLLAAFTLRHFRAAAKKAVADRLGREASRLDQSAWERAGAIATLIDWLADTWHLSTAEQLNLLALNDEDELAAARSQSPQQASHELLARLAMLVDIYHALHALLPKLEAADEWLRRPNQAPMFNDATALNLMLERGRTGIEEVLAYLWSQLR